VENLSAVRVLAVDDSAPWRGFVAAHLQEQSVQVVGTAADGSEAVHEARALRPDIVIMDVWMSKLNGLAATREISRVAPESRILIVTNETDPGIVQAAFAVGARGYVLKSMVAVDLLRAVETIARGELFVGRGLVRGGGPPGASR